MPPKGTSVNVVGEGFPTRDRLWRGSILASIAHAVYQAAEPSDWSVAWDGDAYVRNDGSGTRGAVVFENRAVVGTFCDGQSARAPWRSDVQYDLDHYLGTVPTPLRPLAERAAGYFIYTYDGTDAPAITAIFWSDGERLTAAEPWREVVEYGAHILTIESLPTDEAVLRALQEDLELSPTQIGLVKTLYERRMAAPTVPVVLSPSERRLLFAEGDAGRDESRSLLADVGIILE